MVVVIVEVDSLRWTTEVVLELGEFDSHTTTIKIVLIK